MGKQVNIHPIGVIVAILVMGKLLGIIGVICAVPAAVVVMTLVNEFTSKSKSDSDKPDLSKFPRTIEQKIRNKKH